MISPTRSTLIQNKSFIDLTGLVAHPTQLLSRELGRMKEEQKVLKAENKDQREDMLENIRRLKESLANVDHTVSREIRYKVEQITRDNKENEHKVRTEWDRMLNQLKREYEQTLENEVKMLKENNTKEKELLVVTYLDILDVMEKIQASRQNVVISDEEVNRYSPQKLSDILEKIKLDIQREATELDRTYNAGKAKLQTIAEGEMFKTPMLGFIGSTKSLFQLSKRNRLFLKNTEEVLNKLRTIINKKLTIIENIDVVSTHNEIVDRFTEKREAINKKYQEQIAANEREFNQSINSEVSESKSMELRDGSVIRLKNEIQIRESNYKKFDIQAREQEEELQNRIIMAQDSIERNKKVIDFDDNTVLELENEVKRLSALVMGRKRYEMLKTVNITDLDIEVNPQDNDTVLLLRAEAKMKETLEKYANDKEIMGSTLEEHRTNLYDAQRKLDRYYILSANYKLGVKRDGEIITEEDFTLSTENRSIAIVYKPEYLSETINLVKYMTHQVMNDYHPNAYRVNILNGSFNMDFNNLQVITDKVNEKTGKLEKGRVYAQSFSIQEDITEITLKQRATLNDMQRKGLLSTDFSGMLSAKRLKGAMLDQYTTNIILGATNKADLRIFSGQSNITGITNIEFFNYFDLFENDEEKGQVITPEGKDLLKDYSIVIETIKKYRAGSEDVMDVQVLDTKQNIKEMIAYKPLPERDFVEYGQKLRTRYFAIPKTGYTTEDYIERHCPEYFSGIAEVGVQLHFGPKEGDMSVPGYIWLDGDSDNVHLFIAGTTGGGKSNTLAVMTNMLKMQYPPSQLEVIYFDFKIVEVMMHAKPYKMPHCIAMCGTDCGDYIKSLMEYVVSDMDKRMAYFKTWGTVNLKDCRKIVLKEIERLEKEGKIAEAFELKKNLPTRTLLIVDEAAQAFQMEESVKEAFQAGTIRLSQLARSAGIHMIYVSQDPSRMPDEVMNNFKARACTKANKEVSTMVLKNDFASWPEHDILGFFCSNINGGDPAYNVKYMVPFNDNDFSTPIFSKLSLELTNSRGEVNRDPVIFDQDEPLYQFKFEEKVKAIGNPIMTDKRKQIYLGEPVRFSKEVELSELTLFRDAKQHITLVSPTVTTKENVIRRLYEGIKGEKHHIFTAFLKDKPFWFSYENCFGMTREEFIENDYIEMGKDDMKEASITDGLINLAGIKLEEGEQYDEEGNIIEEEEQDIDDDSHEYTTLIFLFDSDVVDYRGGYSQSELMHIFSEASSKGIHVIFVESGYGRSIGEPYVNYVLASAVTDTDFPRVIRDVNKAFVKKWVKEGDGTETFKPLSYNV